MSGKNYSQCTKCKKWSVDDEPCECKGQSELSATPCSAVASDDIQKWRKATRHAFAKHDRAMENFMRWRFAWQGKGRRRLNKWMREVERTLYAIPDPPEIETA
jgi:hypothetical protein